MKTFSAFLFCLLATALEAAHVEFDLTDFVTGPIARRTMYVKPTGTPKTNIAEIVTGDALRRFTGTNGVCTISNMVHGVYSCVVFGPETNTTFSILVPDSTNLLNASDLLTATTSTSDASGYTIAQANAKFVLKNSGWASNLVVTNLTVYGGSSGLSSNLESLSDVDLGPLVYHQILRYQSFSGMWTNELMSLGDIDDVNTAGAATGKQLTYTAPGIWVPQYGLLSSLSDVTLAGGIADGHVLKYSGGVWTNMTDELGTNAASASLILSNTVFVTKNGDDATAVKGDSSKSYASLTNAINALANGDTMLIYPGEYVVGITNSIEALKLVAKTNVSIIGIGLPKIYGSNSPLGHLLTISNCSNIKVEGLEMIGWGINYATNNYMSVAINLSGAGGNKNVLIQNCIFRDWVRFGVARIDWVWPTDEGIIIRDNYFSRIGGTNLTGDVLADGAAIEITWSNTKAEGNVIDNCFRGIEIYEGNTTIPIRNIQILNNLITRTWGSSIILFNDETYATNVADVTIVNNTIRGGATQPYLADSTPIDVRSGINIDISHNHISDYELGGYGGVVISAVKAGAGRYNISGNTLHNLYESTNVASVGPGMYIHAGGTGGSNFSGALIVGNIFSQIVRQGLICSINNAVIANNSFQNIGYAQLNVCPAIWLRVENAYNAMSNVLITGNIIADFMTNTTDTAFMIDCGVTNAVIQNNFVGPTIGLVLSNNPCASTNWGTNYGQGYVYGPSSNEVMTLALIAASTNDSWVTAYNTTSNKNYRIAVNDLLGGGAGASNYLTFNGGIIYEPNMTNGDSALLGSGPVMWETGLDPLIMGYVPINTTNLNGVVSASAGFINKVWKTDGSGVPGWATDATGAGGTEIMIQTNNTHVGLATNVNFISLWPISVVASNLGGSNWVWLAATNLINQTNGVAYGLTINNTHLFITTNGTLTASNIVTTNFSIHGVGASKIEMSQENGVTNLTLAVYESLAGNIYLRLPTNVRSGVLWFTNDGTATNLFSMIAPMGAPGQFLAYSNGVVLFTNAPSGGAGTPQGGDMHMQFNDGGSFAGTSNLFWDLTNYTLRLTNGTLSIASNIIVNQGGAHTPGLIKFKSWGGSNYTTLLVCEEVNSDVVFTLPINAPVFGDVLWYDGSNSIWSGIADPPPEWGGGGGGDPYPIVFDIGSVFESSVNFIYKAGKIGIKTNDPQAELHVFGDAIVDTTLAVNGLLTNKGPVEIAGGLTNHGAMTNVGHIFGGASVNSKTLTNIGAFTNGGFVLIGGGLTNHGTLTNSGVSFLSQVTSLSLTNLGRMTNAGPLEVEGGITNHGAMYVSGLVFATNLTPTNAVLMTWARQTNFSVTVPTDGHVLKYSAAHSAWTNAAEPAAGSITVMTNGKAIGAEATNNFVAGTGITIIGTNYAGESNNIFITVSANLQNFSTVATNYFIPTNATLYHYVYVPAGSMLTMSNATANTFSNAALAKRDTFDFDDTNPEWVAFNATLGDGWDLGTIKAKFHWQPNATNGGASNVIWGIRARQTINTNLGAIQGTIAWVTNAGSGITNQFIVSSASPAVTVSSDVAGLVKGYPIDFAVVRDAGNASDDRAGDARLMAVEIQYGVKFNLSTGW